MNIKVNGEPQTIEQPSLTLRELLTLNKVEQPETVSVQINGRFVDSPAYPNTHIAENDEVDFLYFLGGGNSR